MMAMDLVELTAILPHIRSIEAQLATSLAASISAMFGGKR